MEFGDAPQTHIPADPPPAPDAAAAPAENFLIARLLAEIKLPPQSIGRQGARPLADLKAVLAADYRRVPGFPEVGLAHELHRIVPNLISPYRQIWKCWQDRQSTHQLRRVFNWGDIVINAQPYMRGTGLSLWGFSCEAKVKGRRKFVIFLNTAHDPGAVAATIGHELGHYIYASIGGEGTGEEGAPMAMGTMFTHHLRHEHELFSDAVVALSAYGRPAVNQILRAAGAQNDGPEAFLDRMRTAFRAIDPDYRIDLSRRGLAAHWRIRYLTLMVHFFKLRWALLDVAGI